MDSIQRERGSYFTLQPISNYANDMGIVFDPNIYI